MAIWHRSDSINQPVSHRCPTRVLRCRGGLDLGLWRRATALGYAPRACFAAGGARRPGRASCPGGATRRRIRIRSLPPPQLFSRLAFLSRIVSRSVPPRRFPAHVFGSRSYPPAGVPPHPPSASGPQLPLYGDAAGWGGTRGRGQESAPRPRAGRQRRNQQRFPRRKFFAGSIPQRLWRLSSCVGVGRFWARLTPR